MASELLNAARRGDEAAIGYVLHGHRHPAELLKAIDDTGRTALHLAARQGHEESVRRLVAAGAAIDCAGGPSGGTPLMSSCARLLMEAGADVHLRCAKGVCALYLACQYGHLECARLCLDAGASVDAATQEGGTPLFAACKHGHTDCACLCLDAGANVEAAFQSGWTSLLAAMHQGQLTTVQLMCLHRRQPRPAQLRLDRRGPRRASKGQLAEAEPVAQSPPGEGSSARARAAREAEREAAAVRREAAALKEEEAAARAEVKREEQREAEARASLMEAKAAAQAAEARAAAAAQAALEEAKAELFSPSPTRSRAQAIGR
jgi:pyruvate/2-oxoglutarate dehydrogenase complex dihydrolipoamide acyltransferase (E2) component